MPKVSAGLLPYRFTQGRLEVFLVHMGGPFWKNKDRHAWSIPKGEMQAGDDPLETALREFSEETGFQADPDRVVELGSIKQSSGKTVHVWAFEGDFDPEKIQSNSFTIQWPPESGNTAEFPEVDRAGWFSLQEASAKLVKGQVQLLEILKSHVHP